MNKETLHVSSLTCTGFWKGRNHPCLKWRVADSILALFKAKSLEPPWGLQESTTPAEFVPVAFWSYRPATKVSKSLGVLLLTD